MGKTKLELENRFQINLTKEKKQELEKIAEDEGISMTQLVRKALGYYFSNKEMVKKGYDGPFYEKTGEKPERIKLKMLKY